MLHSFSYLFARESDVEQNLLHAVADACAATNVVARTSYPVHDHAPAPSPCPFPIIASFVKGLKMSVSLVRVFDRHCNDGLHSLLTTRKADEVLALRLQLSCSELGPL